MSSTDTNAKSDGLSAMLQKAKAMVARTSAYWRQAVDSRSPTLSGAMQQINGGAATGESRGDGSE
jgi:uncharacterized membrane protein